MGSHSDPPCVLWRWFCGAVVLSLFTSVYLRFLPPFFPFVHFLLLSSQLGKDPSLLMLFVYSSQSRCPNTPTFFCLVLICRSRVSFAFLTMILLVSQPHLSSRIPPRFLVGFPSFPPFSRVILFPLPPTSGSIILAFTAPELVLSLSCSGCWWFFSFFALFVFH